MQFIFVSWDNLPTKYYNFTVGGFNWHIPTHLWLWHLQVKRWSLLVPAPVRIVRLSYITPHQRPERLTIMNASYTPYRHLKKCPTGLLLPSFVVLFAVEQVRSSASEAWTTCCVPCTQCTSGEQFCSASRAGTRIQWVVWAGG